MRIPVCPELRDSLDKMRFSTREKGITVCLNLPVCPFDDFAELRPFGEVFEVESDVVGFGEVVEIARVELQEVGGGHRPCVGHVKPLRVPLSMKEWSISVQARIAAAAVSVWRQSQRIGSEDQAPSKLDRIETSAWSEVS